jgi:DUF4097 and DUF4098 domain-containing protein YvlB
MKRLAIIIIYAVLSLTAVAASFTLMALTSSTAYAHDAYSDDDDDSDSDSNSDSNGHIDGGRSVNETRPAKADGEVRIDNVAGTIRIVGWDKSQVQVTGTLGEAVQRLDITSDTSGIEIRVVLPHHVNSSDCGECADLQIQVPKGSHLEVSTVSADVEANGISGAARLGTVSGGISLNSSASRIDVKTVSGDTTVVGSAKGAQITATSVSGTLRVSDVDGSVDAENVSGDTKVASRHVSTLKMSATSGNLIFDGSLFKGGNYDLNNVSGDVEVVTDGTPDARFDVSSFSGDIDNGFGPKPTRVSKYSPGMELHFTSGSGSATLSARTLSGDIHLHN